MTGDWLASFEALYKVYADEAFSNIAINEAVSNHKDCDSGFVRMLVKGVIRDSLRLDAIVDKLASKGIKGIKLRTLIIIKMGLYAIDKLDGVPEHAAVNESVKLAKKLSRGSDGFVNALLRSYLRQRDKLTLEDNDEIRYGFPQELANMIREQYGDEADRIMEGLNTPPALVLRTNLLKNTREELLEELASEGVEAKACEDTRTAIIAKGNNIISSRLYKDGKMTAQSLPSIKAMEAFNPAPGSKVLDICAAPGGKSCAMAEIMDNKGSITACDIYEHRLDLIEANASRVGADIVTTELADGTVYRKEYDGKFDYVLADVPCSGLGVISSKPEIKLKNRIADYDELYATQLNILENAFKYAKDKGVVMYSTCTINRKENEEIIDCFVEQHRFAQILEKCLFFPYNNSVGFFYCILKKVC